MVEENVGSREEETYSEREELPRDSEAPLVVSVDGKLDVTRKEDVGVEEEAGNPFWDVKYDIDATKVLVADMEDTGARKLVVTERP